MFLLLRPGITAFITLLIFSTSSQLFAQNQALLCAALEKVVLPEVISLNATFISAGKFTPGGVGSGSAVLVTNEFCRVEITTSPSVGIEVWLPTTDNWNGKYLAVGGGGLAGNFSYGALLPAINANYVTSSTDTGHKTPDLQWLTDPVKLRDFGYRAIHEMTLNAKALITAYYNRQADYSYFNGCSQGGRQALMEAQRFPDDFNGIVAGAPVNHFNASQTAKLWMAKASKPVAETLLTPSDMALVSKGVMAQCDALDGVTDGVLENPRACQFEPASLQCPHNDLGACLSTKQVTALKLMYQGPVTSTGEQLFFGYVPGAESPEFFPTSWLMTMLKGDDVTDPIPLAYFSRAVFGDADWNWRTFDFDTDLTRARQLTGNIMDATDSNLDVFQNNGGKLLLYHGWSDLQVVPEGTVAYYENIIANNASSSPANAALMTAEYARLFMVPGMGHCGGGPGTDVFDKQGVIEQWVEQGQAPNMIPATHVQDGKITKSRPLCAFPQTAHYNGSGDSNNINNFSCQE